MEVISYEMAAKKGLIFYFTGIPCRRGHVCQRRTRNKQCEECYQRQIQIERKRYTPDRQREYRKDRPHLREAIQAYKKDNREKVLVHKKVRHALLTGKLEKCVCERCGNPDSEAHHEDYSRPLDVVWLCRAHHNERHREIELAIAGG